MEIPSFMEKASENVSKKFVEKMLPYVDGNRPSFIDLECTTHEEYIVGSGVVTWEESEKLSLVDKVKNHLQMMSMRYINSTLIFFSLENT